MIVGVLILGLLLIATSLQNTQSELAALLQRDIIGTQGFLLWILAIFALGAIGYIPGLERTSRNLILLLMVVIVLRNGGVFANAQAALQAASQAGPAPTAISPQQTNAAGSANVGGAGGGGGGGGGSDTGSAIGGIASDAATGAAIAGPYGAAAGAAYGIISDLF